MKRSRVQPWGLRGGVVSRARQAAAAGRDDAPTRRDARLLAGRLERLRQVLPELAERVELAEEVAELAAEPASPEEHLEAHRKEHRKEHRLGRRLADLLALRACGRGVASALRS